MAIYRLGDILESISETKKAILPQEIINTGDVLKGEIRPIVERKKVLGQFKKTAKINNILFSEIRPGNGRWALVKEDINNCLISTKMLVLRSRDIIIPEYAFYILTSVVIEDIVKIAESRSGTFPQITFSNISHLEVDIPSLEEQNKIIDIIKPYENFFINYSNTVRIDQVEKCKNDIENLIDIIKPIEDSLYMLEKIEANVLNFIKHIPKSNNTISLKDISKNERNKKKKFITIIC